METTQNKFFIITIIDYYPREHISQNVTTVLRDQGGVTSIDRRPTSTTTTKLNYRKVVNANLGTTDKHLRVNCFK